MSAIPYKHRTRRNGNDDTVPRRFGTTSFAAVKRPWFFSGGIAARVGAA